MQDRRVQIVPFLVQLLRSINGFNGLRTTGTSRLKICPDSVFWDRPSSQKELRQAIGRRYFFLVSPRHQWI
jgi:hypothetical protein